ncbi:MAG: tetratricopeptide repeat protein, partial [Nitrolancea sp.]
ACAFDDGVIFVDLSPVRDSALVLPTVAQHVGVDERGELPLGDRLLSALRGKQLLLVLDNLEHLVAVGVEWVPILAQSPRMVLLATSRIPLRVRGEREYRVAPLELPPEEAGAGDIDQSASVALFLDRVRAVGVDLQLDDVTTLIVAEICRRLDGLPLALELAAAWAPLLEPVALLERLERRLPLLAGGPSDLPLRQRTMLDTIAWSYELLDPIERRTFRRMAVLNRGCGFDAAAAICFFDEDANVVLPRLVSLVEKNLLRRDEPDFVTAQARLSMLETIREYGLERLEESGEVEVLRARHSRFFLELAEQAALAWGGPDQIVWSNRLESDHDNIRVAVDWTCNQGDSRTGLRFAVGLWRPWSASGHGQEAKRWLERILALPATDAETPPDTLLRTRAHVGASVLALEYGALDEAGTSIVECLRLARACGDRRALIDALNAAGLISRTRGDYADAAKALEEACELAVAANYLSGDANATAELALTTFLTGDSPRAQELLEQAIAMFRDLGDTRGLAAGLRELGWMFWHNGDAERGQALRKEALVLFRALGDAGQVAETLWALGISAQYRGDHARANELYEESLALRRARGDERGAAQVLSTLGQVALHRRDLESAREMLTDAFESTAQLGDRWGLAMIGAILGHVELVSGNLATAGKLLGESAARYATIGNYLYLPWCLEGMAGVAVAEQRLHDAALLLGAREAMLQIVGRGLPPADPPGFTVTQEFVRAALHEIDIRAAYETGCGLAQETVVALTTAPSAHPLAAQPLSPNKDSERAIWIAEGAPKN